MIHTYPVGEEDSQFLYELYVTTRWEEVRSWGWEETMIHPFLKLQWTAQQHSYSLQYPGAEHLILAYDGQKVGQVLVVRSSASLSLVDLSVIPAWRNQGFGTLFIQELQAEAAAASIPIHLSVLQNNDRALRLYERLGFRHKAYSGLHIQMEWSSLPTL